MLGTLAVIMVIAAFIGGSELFGKFFNTDEKWKYIILAGILGGGFGIYGTISGITMQRDPGRYGWHQISQRIFGSQSWR